MGLTIHYGFKPPLEWTTEDAKAAIEKLHAFALELKGEGHFEEVSDTILEFSHRQEVPDLRDLYDEDWGWALIQAGQYVDYAPGRSRSINPLEAFIFTTWPGFGCEGANFGLCRYPAEINVDGQMVPTGFFGWYWHSFCKTQYANEYGTPHFIHCHLTVCSMLEKAQELFEVEVSDEGNYWTKRDVNALAREVTSWDQMIAGFTANLRDALGDGGMQLVSAMDSRLDLPELREKWEAGLKTDGIRNIIQTIEPIAKLFKDVTVQLAKEAAAKEKAEKEAAEKVEAAAKDAAE